jgi:hypothetical protein
VSIGVSREIRPRSTHCSAAIVAMSLPQDAIQNVLWGLMGMEGEAEGVFRVGREPEVSRQRDSPGLLCC